MSWAAAAARGAAPAAPAPASLVAPGETVAVLDANALIASGISKYVALADRLVTIKEVLAEVRDAASRSALGTAVAAGAASIGVVEPSTASLAEGKALRAFKVCRVTPCCCTREPGLCWWEARGGNEGPHASRSPT
jgi:hypothetical protein